MVTTSTMRIRANFRQNRLLQGLAAWYAAFWIVTALQPLDRHDWVLENLLAVALVALLLATYRIFPLSDLAYVLITAFMTLHAIGAHYTYALVPMGDWVKETFGFSRNHFDRLVHFSFGLLMAYPIREVFLRVANARGFWAYYLPLDVTLAFSALYEIMEMAIAQIVAPNTGDAWLGTQGDVWDAQKDMAAAFSGAVLCMCITALVRARRQKSPVLLAGGAGSAA